MTRPDPLAGIPDEQLRPAPRPRPVQFFSAAYLERCRRLRTEDILRFLEEFRLHAAAAEAPDAPPARPTPAGISSPSEPKPKAAA